MDIIRTVAKKTKSGKFKIDLPESYKEDEIQVVIIIEEPKEKSKKTLADFAGKLEWKGDPVEYQKMIRNEWK